VYLSILNQQSMYEHVTGKTNVLTLYLSIFNQQSLYEHATGTKNVLTLYLSILNQQSLQEHITGTMNVLTSHRTKCMEGPLWYFKLDCLELLQYRRNMHCSVLSKVEDFCHTTCRWLSKWLSKRGMDKCSAMQGYEA
jgi:hypothetical protein